jgi:hypothetical protein
VSSQLVGSSFANGAQLPNYVNGRLLAAEDLATGQSTLLRRDTMIGQSTGPGIVAGLWVTATGTTLAVAAGTGITPAGEPVSLPASVTLPLSVAGAPAASAGGGFTSCATAPSGSQAALTAGAYVLTAMPACQPQGQAPMAIPPGSDTPVACTAQWQVEGIQFKAIPLQLGTDVDGISVNQGNRRNLLAHWCFGTAQLASLGADPFNFNPAYRGLDQLASTDLTSCDLPLCVFYWDAGAISFIDNWSVRRRTTRPDVSAANWSAAVADQRSADGEARFLQFQDQILDLVSAGVSRTTVSSNVFGILPPVGFLPIAIDTTIEDIALLGRMLTDAKDAEGRPMAGLSIQILERVLEMLHQLGPQSGFVPGTFFQGQVFARGGLITWDTAYFALRQSYFLEPITTTQTQLPESAVAAAARIRAAMVPSGRSTLASRPTSLPITRPTPFPITRPTPFPIIRPFPIPLPEPAPQPTAPMLPEAIVYYYVVENFISVLEALAGTGPTVTPYLVFMNKQLWLPDTPAPFGLP